MYALRALTATTLALWLGVLACVLGCSQGVLASAPSRSQISESRSAIHHDGSGKMAGAAPCCHHHNGTSDKNKQNRQTLSCCPLDATLIQKRDVAAFKTIHPDAVALMLLVFDPSIRLSPSKETNAPTVCHPGRGVLLQSHVLRI
jgi:hypothetical protein